MVSIAHELHERLAELMARRRLGPAPPNMIDRRPDRIFIGKATKEHRAMGILYGEVRKQHNQMHEEAGLEFGVNPYVPADHFRQHVLMSLLHEMLDWSVSRDYPEQQSGLDVRFDRDWNMFGRFPDRLRNPDRPKKP